MNLTMFVQAEEISLYKSH